MVVVPVIHGVCPAFCPGQEHLERARTHELSRFEQPTAGFPGLEPIKKYRRAAAGRHGWDAADLRPAPVLLRTLRHLFTTVLVWPQCGFDGRKPVCIDEFLAVYHFVNDRIRSVRQDFTVQRIEDASLVTALQQIIRFYLLSRLRSVQLQSRVQAQDWSDKLNHEQLTSALSQLQALEDKGPELVPAHVTDGGEFMAYGLLLHADQPHTVAWMLRKRSSKLHALARVQRALRTFVALQTGDFNAFFAEFQAMTLLERAAALHHLETVWTQSLRMMNKGFGKQDRFPLEELARWMNLADPHSEDEGGERAEILCNALNVSTQRYPPPPSPPTHRDTGSLAASWDRIEDLAEHVASLAVTRPTSLGFARFKLAPLHDQLHSEAGRLLLRDAALRIENNASEESTLLTPTDLILGTATCC